MSSYDSKDHFNIEAHTPQRRLHEAVHTTVKYIGSIRHSLGIKRSLAPYHAHIVSNNPDDKITDIPKPLPVYLIL